MKSPLCIYVKKISSCKYIYIYMCVYYVYDNYTSFIHAYPHYKCLNRATSPYFLVKQTINMLAVYTSAKAPPSPDLSPLQAVMPPLPPVVSPRSPEARPPIDPIEDTEEILVQTQGSTYKLVPQVVCEVGANKSNTLAFE